jgi:tetratricopeptide (TPR) repeat protein
MRYLNNILLYNWKNLDIAVIMEGDFDAAGIKLDVSGEHSFLSFIKHDLILMVVSDDMLKSPQDMREAISIYSTATIRDKMIPIITSDARVFDDMGRDSYVSYWENEARKLENQVADRDSIIKIDDISGYADDYIRIADNIISFIGYIIDKGCFVWPAIRKSQYGTLFEYMGYGENEIKRFNHAIKEHKKAQAQENQLSGYNKVRKLMERSLAVNPDDNETWHNLADLLEEQYGEYDKAKECYMKALALHPDDIDAHYDLAIMLRSRLHDYPAAVEHYQAVININPRYVAAHYELALLLKDHLHDKHKGKYHYKIACELDPDLRSSILDEAFGI